jgi:hypothetical protein
MTHYTIILPLAGRSKRFPGVRPKWMLVAPDGELMLHKALGSVSEFGNGRVVCGILRDHDEQYGIQEGLRQAFGDRALEIVILPHDTSGSADTVAQIISAARVSGPILIKDCDSWFTCPHPSMPNTIAVANLGNQPSAINVRGKSFVQIDDRMIVTAMTEKTVSSEYVSVGGYGFEDARAYASFFEKARAIAGPREVFVSHVVIQAIAERWLFRAEPVQDYVDVGTIREWNIFRNRQPTLFVDVDGVIFRNSGAFFGRLWDDKEELLVNNVRILNALIRNGAQLVLVSARPERYRQKMEVELSAAGLTWKVFIMDCLHSRRYLINDYAPSNPYPSAVAINVRRGRDDLEELLPEDGNPS